MVAETLKGSDQKFSIGDNYHYVLIGLGISLLHLVLPLKRTIDKVLARNDPKIQKAKSYDQVKLDFITVISEIISHFQGL